MVPSDFEDWVDPAGLELYSGGCIKFSETSPAMISLPDGLNAVLAHFDISITSSAPMYNSVTQEDDLQKTLHIHSLRNKKSCGTLVLTSSIHLVITFKIMKHSIDTSQIGCQNSKYGG